MTIGFLRKESVENGNWKLKLEEGTKMHVAVNGHQEVKFWTSP